MRSPALRRLVFQALLAAVYAALTMALSFMSYGPVQFRIAEALCILPFFFPGCVWGLTVGCLLANLISAYGILDIVFGTLATLLCCLAVAALGRGNRRSWPRCIAACFMPVVFNAVIVGALIAYSETDCFFTGAFWPAFWFDAGTVGLGELVVMYVIGLPLMRILPKKKIYTKMEAVLLAP